MTAVVIADMAAPAVELAAAPRAPATAVPAPAVRNVTMAVIISAPIPLRVVVLSSHSLEFRTAFT